MFNRSTCLAIGLFGLIASGISPDRVIAQETEETPDSQVVTDSIIRFVNDILAVHPVLQSANAAVEVAAAQERSSDRPLYNPGLEFDAEDAVDKTVQIGISQTIDWSGKKKAAYEASGARRLSAEVAYRITRKNLASEILDLLSEYWSAVELARLASSSADLMHDFAQQAKMRYDAGDMAQVEYETAALAYAEVRMRQAGVAADLAEVIRELMVLRAPENIQTWPRMPPTLPALAVQPGDIDQLIAILPEVREARAEVAAATADVELARRLKKPDPTFGFRVGDEDSERLIGFSFSIPLHVRNNFNEDVLASMALRTQTEADAVAIERDIRARLLVAMERYATIRAGWIVWEETGATSIERRAEALRKLWDAREINMSDFLIQVRLTLATRATAIDLRANLWSAWIEYLNASNQLDGWLQDTETKLPDPVERITMRNN
jgi:cobalt-zinc-cadmium efflux system outer membrane protein